MEEDEFQRSERLFPGYGWFINFSPRDVGITLDNVQTVRETPQIRESYDADHYLGASDFGRPL